jgi:hypothetical protein
MKVFNFPVDFVSDDNLLSFAAEARSPVTTVLISSESSSKGAESDVYSIQRLISFIAAVDSLIVEWDSAVWNRVKTSPSLYPLLSILVFAPKCLHRLRGVEISSNELLKVQRALTRTRFNPDWFSDAFILLNADHVAGGFNPTIYTSQSSSDLRTRDALEALIYQYLYGQSVSNEGEAIAQSRLEPISAVVYELFENTHDHAMQREQTLNLHGKQFSLRGIVFRRVTQSIKKLSSGLLSKH